VVVSTPSVLERAAAREEELIAELLIGGELTAGGVVAPGEVLREGPEVEGLHGKS
jgi:hypothetical protein